MAVYFLLIHVNTCLKYQQYMNTYILNRLVFVSSKFLCTLIVEVAVMREDMMSVS